MYIIYNKYIYKILQFEQHKYLYGAEDYEPLRC